MEHLRRKEMVRLFRSRLAEAMQRANLNRSQLARRAGIDRSTVSQLLGSEDVRMPRAGTVAAVAAALQVSVDWLLGLSGEARLGAEVLDELLEMTPTSRSPVDENLARWHEEAAGYKIRHVPASIPDLLKIEPVLEYEYRHETGRIADQAIAASQQKLAYSKLPEADFEICVASHVIELFARGQGAWSGLTREVRGEQLGHMARLLEELYPQLRMYLFDGLSRFSAPYTVFGPIRAALYVGQMYLVFNTTDHVRALSRHFDDLIRAAVVQADGTARFLLHLQRDVHRD
jgi:transcriptional regulator with XRE-family HTH domain